MPLPMIACSYGRTRLGWCGALLDSESECSRPAGHLHADPPLPHRSVGPYGTATVDYDDDGNVLYRDIPGTAEHAARDAYQPRHRGEPPTKVAESLDGIHETARQAFANPHARLPLVLTDEQAAETGVLPGDYVNPRPARQHWTTGPGSRRRSW